MKTYSILELAEELDTNKSKIRRSIDRLELEALNEHTRTKNNEPKLYDSKAKDLIRADIEPQNAQRTSERTKQPTNDAQEQAKIDDIRIKDTRNVKRTTQTTTHAQRNATRDNDTELVKILKEQLEQANLDKEKEIERLIKSYEKQLEQANLDKATLSRHLDQQQVISLNSQKQIESLQLELKGTTELDETKVSDEEIEQKKSIFNIFKRNKQ